MLEERGTEFTYREYTEKPLSAEEIADVVGKLGVHPKALLRKNDKAYKQAGVTGEESEGRLVELMAQYPSLLQRPIAIDGERAIVCRPADLLDAWL